MTQDQDPRPGRSGRSPMAVRSSADSPREGYGGKNGGGEDTVGPYPGAGRMKEADAPAPGARRL